MRSGKDHLRKAAEGGAGGAPPAAARKGEVAPARAARRACRPFAKEKAAAPFGAAVLFVWRVKMQSRRRGMICTPKVGQTFGGAYFNVKRKEV